MQNAVVHFWNAHLHLFRKGLGAHAMPEVISDRFGLDTIDCDVEHGNKWY